LAHRQERELDRDLVGKGCLRCDDRREQQPKQQSSRAGDNPARQISRDQGAEVIVVVRVPV